MIFDAVGLTLPFAMAIALGPIPIVAAILVVDSAGGKAAGLSFALGWAIGITASRLHAQDGSWSFFRVSGFCYP